ncbi:MAG: anti-sigma factor [Candidatus Aminicenantaceae bacterium]
MKCKKIEKWISDSIDNELSERKREQVENHLQKCSLCRNYKESMERIQSTVKNMDYGKVSPGYWGEFPQKIREKIMSLEVKDRKLRPFALGWKWAVVGAVLAIAVAIGLSIFYPRFKTVQEVYVFSFEDSLEQISQEISGNEELEDIFNLVIMASIREFLDEQEWENSTYSYDVSSFLDGLTEEELSLLDLEIKKEIKS